MSTKWNMVFPREYTLEELVLKSKYDTLRKLKQSLKAQTENKKENLAINENKKSLERLKIEAVNVLKKKGGIKDTKKEENRTHHFKRPSSQSRELLSEIKRSAKNEFYMSDADSQTRSVVVKGEQLTPDILRRFFSGIIWKLRISESADSAVVTFATPESACMAVKMDGSVAENGQKLAVSNTKKRNQSWKEILVEDQKLSADKHLPQMKRTVYVSYDGKMTSKELHQLFYAVGTVKAVYLSKRKEKQSRELKNGYALVTFMFEEEAEKAVQLLNGTLWKGRPLTISPQKVPRHDNLGGAIVVQKDGDRDLITFGDPVLF